MQTLRFGQVVIPSSQCWNCKWLNENELRCPAFGNAPIPEEIQFNLHNHQFAYEGDRGIRFEAR